MLNIYAPIPGYRLSKLLNTNIAVKHSIT